MRYEQKWSSLRIAPAHQPSLGFKERVQICHILLVNTIAVHLLLKILKHLKVGQNPDQTGSF
jgi:hypothetical protein